MWQSSQEQSLNRFYVTIKSKNNLSDLSCWLNVTIKSRTFSQSCPVGSMWQWGQQHSLKPVVFFHTTQSTAFSTCCPCHGLPVLHHLHTSNLDTDKFTCICSVMNGCFLGMCAYVSYQWCLFGLSRSESIQFDRYITSLCDCAACYQFYAIATDIRRSH